MKSFFKLILLWLINLALIGGILGLVYLIANDAELTIKAHQESYLVARARADVTNWREALDASAGDRARIAALFINRDSLINFIEELETAASESGVNYKLGEPTIEATVLKLTLQISGSFPNIYRLLTRLENLPYRLRLEQIGLAGDVEWNGQVAIRLLSFDDQHVQD